MSKLRIGFDKIMMSAAAGGCGWTFFQAWHDGRAPLMGQTPALECANRGRKRLDLTPELCNRLRKRGYLVIDDFLSPEEVEEAMQASKVLEFALSPNERDREQVRTDQIYFFENCAAPEATGGLGFIQDQLHRLAFDIVQSQYWRDKTSNCPVVSWLGVPAVMQVALYGASGTYYTSHLDTCSDSFFSLGLTGWLRSLYLRKRYLTCIVYLNPGWVPEHGGCLRMHEKLGDHHTDIEPRAGRLVIFSSVDMVHAVLPNFAPRLACSVWLIIND